MAKRREELADYMHQEIGADRAYEDFILDLTIEELKETAGSAARNIQGFVPESIINGMKAMVQKRPYGVILGIAPWNAPYNLGLRSVLYALAAGNTTVMKGSEFSPRCHWAIADIFREAGLPNGCLNLILHSPEDGPIITEALVSHPVTKKINFTGSTRVGSIIAEMAGKHLKPVLMELGGKSGAIIMPDADIDVAALHCANGAFFNAGQICMSTERILVHEAIAPQFKEKLAAVTRERFGSEDAIPVLVSSDAVDKNQRLLAEAKAKGARELQMFDQKLQTGAGNQMQPVVLDRVSRDMDIYHTESFGPSVSMITFASELEAIEAINDTEYGLSAAVFTEDLRTAFRISEQIDSGAVHINSMTVHTDSTMPHGGIKKSGFGRFNGQQGLDEFMYTKTITWMQ
ncbi:NAD-dependent aldehyde dehydrogenase [Fusarium oxysporum f. sp. conglutinans race 2 54008]|uniref:NAD-dependent aldehyde dehydrogenase n=1 Tax=Fusarium oxysporum f. sp. conglutinans race 2 54008 TaxID=1089457 RepID=X0HZV9_FUSOX|nr:NAD-dependent aldehyde dehydrogenase [Fusarium oxysporum f. sp. conglutinans race 2 54008]KAG6989223.1 Vanillin dehydrogenase [Fusarium oxysporum f. sp. conglutinans]